MKKYYLFITIALLLLSCNKPTVIKLRSYVATYYDVPELNVVRVSDNLSGDQHLINVQTADPAYIPSKNSISILKHDSEGSDKKRYDALCVKHGDMSYNKKIEIPNYDPVIKRTYLAFDLSAISVISDSDFNDQHLAGESLADILVFISVSPYPYIKSGYKETFDWDSGDYSPKELAGFLSSVPKADKNTLHPVSKMLSDIQPSDLILLGNGAVGAVFSLKFHQRPTLSKTHTFTVTLTADDGRVFSNTIEMTFD